MECTVLFTDEFEAWWDALDIEEQISVEAVVELLEARGIALGSPYSSKVCDQQTRTDARIADSAPRASVPGSLRL